MGGYVAAYIAGLLTPGALIGLWAMVATWIKGSTRADEYDWKHGDD